MNAKILTCCAVVAAMTISPAFAAKKKMTKRSAQQQTSTPGAVVGAAVGTAGAVASGAVATAGAIVTAPFNPAVLGPVSTLNGPSCQKGTTVTMGGKKMACQ